MPKEFIQKLTNLVEANMANEKFGPEDLAREAGMSHSSLNRKLNSITNQSASQFIREIRLKKAKELLQNEEATVAEIAYRVGFGSPTYFIRCFHEYFGVAPGELRNSEIKLPVLEEQVVENKTVPSKKRRIPFLLFVTIIIVISGAILIAVYKPLSGELEYNENTIAVLPFVDLSPEKGNTYIINGLREEICNNLLRDFKVKARSDVEKYRNTDLSIQGIAKELNVKFIFNGSGQTVDNKIKFRFQVIEVATGKTIWWNAFQTELSELTSKEIFEIQEDAAIDIADDLRGVVIPKENQQLRDSLPVEKIFAKGVKYMDRVSQIYDAERSEDLLFNAKKMFEQAIKLDSTFAMAYVRLGSIYNDNLYATPDINLSERYLDSAFIMANQALHYDNGIAWAKGIKADYYLKKGMIREFNEAHRVFNNDIDSPEDLYNFWIYVNLQDSYHAIDRFLKMWDRATTGDLFDTFWANIICFCEMGYPEISKDFAEKILYNTKDSLTYIYNMLDIERLTGKYETAVNYGLKAAEMDHGNLPLGRLGQLYLYLRNYPMAYKYLQKETNPLKVRDYIDADIKIGFTYLKNGYAKEANVFFENAIKNCNLEIKFNRINAQIYYSQFYLASIYAARGEKRKAIENLKFLKKREINPLWLVIDLKQSPYFDNIRQEPEFTDVLKDVEAKYQKYHQLTGELIKKKNFSLRLPAGADLQSKSQSNDRN